MVIPPTRRFRKCIDSVDGSCNAFDVFLASFVIEIFDFPFLRMWNIGQRRVSRSWTMDNRP